MLRSEQNHERARKIRAQDAKTARTICKKGIPVFTYAWNSGNPGAGAGFEYIYEFEGRFAVASSEDDTVHGPYDELGPLFEAHPNLLMVNSATESIDCVYIDADELVRMLSFWEPPPDPDSEWLLPMLASMTLPRRPPGFTINDEPWLFTKDRGFHRVADNSDGSAPDPSPS